MKINLVLNAGLTFIKSSVLLLFTRPRHITADGKPQLAFTIQSWSKGQIKQSQEAWSVSTWGKCLFTQLPKIFLAHILGVQSCLRWHFWIGSWPLLALERSCFHMVFHWVRPTLWRHILKSGKSLSIFDKISFKLHREKSTNSSFMRFKNHET